MLEYVRSKNIKEGDVLATTLRDERGMILLRAGTKITERAIKALKIQGFKGIYVEHVNRRESVEIPEPLVDDMDTLYVLSLLRELIEKPVLLHNPYDSRFQVVLKELMDFISEISLSFTKLNSEKKLIFEFEDSKNSKSWLASHAYFTCLYSIGMATRMGIGLKFASDCGLAGLFHDFGKLSFPALVSKPNLNDQERETLRRHPRIMFEVFQKLNMSIDTMYAIWQHHERIDGSGYPNGLKDDKILLSAKIVGLASAYDNLISPSPYNASPMLQAEAIEYLMGNQSFSNDAVRALTEIIAPYAIGEWVALSDGSKALVVKNYVGMPLRPDISLLGTTVSLSRDEKYRNITITGLAE